MSVSLPLSQKGWKHFASIVMFQCPRTLNNPRCAIKILSVFWHTHCEIASIVDVSKIPAHTRPKDTQSLIELTSELCMCHQMDMIAFDVMSP